MTELQENLNEFNEQEFATALEQDKAGGGWALIQKGNLYIVKGVVSGYEYGESTDKKEALQLFTTYKESLQEEAVFDRNALPFRILFEKEEQHLNEPDYKDDDSYDKKWQRAIDMIAMVKEKEEDIPTLLELIEEYYASENPLNEFEALEEYIIDTLLNQDFSALTGTEDLEEWWDEFEEELKTILINAQNSEVALHKILKNLLSWEERNR